MTVDYAAYQQWFSSNALVDFQLLTIPAVGPFPTFGPTPILGFSGIEFHVEPATGPVQVIAAFSIDGTPSTEVVALDWLLTANTTLDAVVPASAQFVTISFQSGNGNPQQAQVYATPVNTAYGGYRWLHPNPENIIGPGTNFPASSNQMFVNFCLMACDAWFSCVPFDATGMLEFHVCTLNANETQANLLFKAVPLSTTVPVTQRLRLPAQPCGVKVINNDGAAAHQGGFALIPAPAGT